MSDPSLEDAFLGLQREYLAAMPAHVDDLRTDLARRLAEYRRAIKMVPRGQAHVQSSFNNTLVTLTDPNGNAPQPPNAPAERRAGRGWCRQPSRPARPPASSRLPVSHWAI